MSTLANHIICQVRINSNSGLDEDTATNTFHFRKPTAVDYDTAAGSIAVVLEDFYTDTATGATNPVRYYYSSAMKTGSNLSQIVTYDGSIPPGSRLPTSHSWSLGSGGGTANLPNECAAVLSFKALEAGVAPFSHQRGRVYLGPISNAATFADTAGPRIPSQMLIDCTKAAKQLQDDVQALGAGYDWCVYSPTSNMLFPVTVAWMDNAVDTQRRRGLSPSVRTTETF